jgi:hypothetical protein
VLALRLAQFRTLVVRRLVFFGHGTYGLSKGSEAFWPLMDFLNAPLFQRLGLPA